MKAVVKRKVVKPKVAKAPKVAKGCEEVVYVKKEIPYDPAKHGYLTSYNVKCPQLTKPYTYTPNVVVYSMITGCGLFAIRGITWITKSTLKQGKEAMKDALSFVGDRTLIATLGDSYKDTQAIMEELGFEKLTSYRNPGHALSNGQPYQQHLYIIRNGKNKDE